MHRLLLAASFFSLAACSSNQDLGTTAPATSPSGAPPASTFTPNDPGKTPAMPLGTPSGENGGGVVASNASLHGVWSVLFFSSHSSRSVELTIDAAGGRMTWEEGNTEFCLAYDWASGRCTKLCTATAPTEYVMGATLGDTNIDATGSPVGHFADPECLAALPKHTGSNTFLGRASFMRTMVSSSSIGTLGGVWTGTSKTDGRDSSCTLAIRGVGVQGVCGSSAFTATRTSEDTMSGTLGTTGNFSAQRVSTEAERTQ